MLIVCTLASGQILLGCFRYYFFLKASNAKVNFGQCLNAVLVALSLNSLIPGKGGDLVKAMVLTSEKEKIIRYSAVTVIERLCDLSILALFTLAGAILTGNTYWQFISIFAVFCFIALLLSMSHAKRIPFVGTKLASLKNIIPSLRVNYKYLILGLSSSATIWITNLIIIYLLLVSVGVVISPIVVISNWPKAIISGILPFTISGFGTRDATFAFSIGATLENTKIFAATFLYTTFLYWYLSIVSMVFIFWKKIKRIKQTTD